MQVNKEKDARPKSKYCAQGFVPVAHAGRLFRGGSVRVALKMVNVVARRESTIKLQPKLTKRRRNLTIRTRALTRKSFAFSFSVAFSCFSKIYSSRKVGLRGFNVLPGVPGVFNALFSGEAGVRKPPASFGVTYSKPTSDTVCRDS